MFVWMIAPPGHSPCPAQTAVRSCLCRCSLVEMNAPADPALARAHPPRHGRGLPGAAGPGVHPLDLGLPPHPAAPGAGASGRLEGRGAYLPQPRPVRRFSCTAEKPKHPRDGMTIPGVSAYARASTSSSSGMRSVRHRSGLAGAPSAYPTARMFTGSRCSGRPRAAFTASGWK